MSTVITSPLHNGPAPTENSSGDAPPSTKGESILSHLGTSIVYTIVSVIILGGLYPLLITGLGMVFFPHQAGGSLVLRAQQPVGSAIIGQLFTKPQYFAGRPSAAGKNGYDPTATGGTNLAPTSKKLIDATRAAIAAVKKANPEAVGEPPMDLITSSGSGIDPDISPQGAAYQAPRIARARGMSVAGVQALIGAHTRGRTFGILGEPRVNVLELNAALDPAK